MTKLYLAQIPKHFLVSRGTIYRDIRQGKLSAEDNGKGRTVVDLSELERVYKRKRAGEVSHAVQHAHSETKESVDDLRNERDRLLKLLEEQATSVKLLTDERIQHKRPRRWWPWRRR